MTSAAGGGKHTACGGWPPTFLQDVERVCRVPLLKQVVPRHEPHRLRHAGQLGPHLRRTRSGRGNGGGTCRCVAAAAAAAGGTAPPLYHGGQGMPAAPLGACPVPSCRSGASSCQPEFHTHKHTHAPPHPPTPTPHPHTRTRTWLSSSLNMCEWRSASPARSCTISPLHRRACGSRLKHQTPLALTKPW